MKCTIALAFLLLLFTGCLDLLRYSERTYTHTLGILANGSRVCYFDMDESGAFSYELSSEVPVNILIAEAKDVVFNESTGEPVTEGLRCITRAYNVKNYTEDIGLGEGSYALIVADSESTIEVTIKTNIRMDCED